MRDCVVVGGGPAGLTAAIYLARFGLKVLVVTKDIGGKMAIAPMVDDYPGVPETRGVDLAAMFEQHVRRLGVEIAVGSPAKDLRREGDLWCVETEVGDTFCGYAVVIAIGCERRKLNVPGESEFLGRGVSYCAVCDAPLFRDKVVAVVGGGNSALVSAIHLTAFAKKVYLIHRRSEFRAFPVYVENATRNPKIETVTNTVVTEIVGDNRVRGVRVRRVDTGEERVLEVDGVFIEIGSEPPKELLSRWGLELDENGFIAVKPDMSTNLPGVFAAGDVAGGRYKARFEQIVVAAAEGAIAANSAYHYILSLRR